MTKLALLMVFAAASAITAPAIATAQTQQTQNVTDARGNQTMTHTPQAGMLEVPGAKLYYERWGQGPMLLIIPGGPQDAGVFTDLARVLADRYQVVAYDPRGNSRSTFDGEIQPLDLDTQADDAAALIDALGEGSAYVFGTSGGAQIGLNLAARHPASVKALLAHEPPTMMLLEDPAEALAFDQALYDTYKSDGVEAAMGMFFGANELSEGPDGPPDFDMPPEAAQTFERVSGNFEYWLAHGMRPLGHYRPDIEALRAGDPRIVVGIGTESNGLPIAEMSMALATALGVDPVAFPGDHSGFEAHADGFAEILHQTLTAQ